MVEGSGGVRAHPVPRTGTSHLALWGPARGGGATGALRARPVPRTGASHLPLWLGGGLAGLPRVAPCVQRQEQRGFRQRFCDNEQNCVVF